MTIGKFIKLAILTYAFLIVMLATIYVVIAVPFPIGVVGKITVNGETISDGYEVIIENLDNGATVINHTKNGYFIVAINGNDGDTIKASITYDGKTYYNETIVNTDYATQYCNISINIEENPPPSENKKPIIVLPSVFQGKCGEEIIFNASNCYDPDGYITKYEWTFYDFPPFSLQGEIVRKIWNKACNIIGMLRVYDNKLASTSKTFNIIISKVTTTTNESEDNITISMPPVANFTVEGDLIFNSTLYLNSTSYDQDGYITNWTWSVDGMLYYGENIIAETPEQPAGSTFDWIGITLVVRDNDGLYDEKSRNIRISGNAQNQTNETYKLIISTKKEVNLVLYKENNVVDEGYGRYFEYELPKGEYRILYTYNGKEYQETITLNSNMEHSLKIESKKTPFGNELIIIALFIALILMRRRKWKK